MVKTPREEMFCGSFQSLRKTEIKFGFEQMTFRALNFKAERFCDELSRLHTGGNAKESHPVIPG